MSKIFEKTDIMIEYYEAWQFLRHHKIFCIRVDDKYYISYFEESLCTETQKVNELKKIDDDKTKKIYIEVWLESGPVQLIDDEIQCTHDLDLDCVAETFEEAIIILAELVKNKYGDKIIDDDFLI